MKIKKLFKNVVVILCTVVAFSSCSIDEKIEFDEHFGGHYEMDMNMSEMMIVMQEMFAEMGIEDDSKKKKKKKKGEESSGNGAYDQGYLLGQALGGKLGEEEEIQKSIDSLELALGITNMTFGIDTLDLIIRIGFDFADLSGLNGWYTHLTSSLGEEEGEVSNKDEIVEWIKLEDNKLTFVAEEGGLFGDAGEDEMMSEYTEMFKVSSHYTFPKPIKKVSNPAYKIDGNVLTLSATLKEMEDNGWDKQDLVVEF